MASAGARVVPPSAYTRGTVARAASLDGSLAHDTLPPLPVMTRTWLSSTRDTCSGRGVSAVASSKASGEAGTPPPPAVPSCRARLRRRTASTKNAHASEPHATPITMPITAPADIAPPSVAAAAAAGVAAADPDIDGEGDGGGVCVFVGVTGAAAATHAASSAATTRGIIAAMLACFLGYRQQPFALLLTQRAAVTAP